MATITCPHCNQRVYAKAYGSSSHLFNDTLHQCDSTSPTLNNIDKVRIGTYTNVDGETTKVSNAMLQGVANKFQGTYAGIEGATLNALTTRGNRKDTHYTEQNYQYIDLAGRRKI